MMECRRVLCEGTLGECAQGVLLHFVLPGPARVPEWLLVSSSNPDMDHTEMRFAERLPITTRRLLLCLLALLAAPLGSCTHYSTVKERRPVAQPGLPKAASFIATGCRECDRNPLAAMGAFLAAADIAAGELRSSPKNVVALRDYNFALSQLFTTIRSAKLKVWEQPLRVPGPGGGYVLTARIAPQYPERNPQLFDYIPAANLEIAGSYMTVRTVKPGLGAPLVAVRREPRSDARQRFALPRAYYGVTAVARFNGRRCEISWDDPLATEEVRMAGRTFPLAADFSAPLALMLSDAQPRKLEILNLLRPGEPAESARIVRLQPFDPDKTTVLVVHGLVDSPATWVPMLNALRGDPEIRKHYQFWFFEYPSGYPYPYSAAIMRRELDAALKMFPQRRPMVLIGHSMGGLISRLMITDSGDRIWQQLFHKSPEKTPLSRASKKMLTESLIFSSRPETGRVIFIASPHRGSNLANGWIGRLGAKLIRAPQTLLKLSLETARFLVSNADAQTARHVPTSVDTLSPTNRFVKAINEIPLRGGVPYHSIIGDRGKGNTPHSSDGFVPYWSSHLDGAVSEKIVPSNHSAHQNPEAITEVLRILKTSRR